MHFLQSIAFSRNATATYIYRIQISELFFAVQIVLLHMRINHFSWKFTIYLGRGVGSIFVKYPRRREKVVHLNSEHNPTRPLESISIGIGVLEWFAPAEKSESTCGTSNC